MPGHSLKCDSAPDLKQLLLADGVINEAAILTPLSGGVSSEICLVESGGHRFVVKRALPKLKVAQDWFADVGRNQNEAAYLRYVCDFHPHNVPRLLSVRSDHGYFCMEYLGPEWSNWKQHLLDGACDLAIAASTGTLLGNIHARSSRDPHLAQHFNTLGNFEQLRIEPYLLATARRHSALRDIFEAEAARLRSQKEVLVHGDFSPKNILVKSDGLVIVDCEVAWYGDAAFDIAFLLNHLLLKSLMHPMVSQTWRAMFDMVWSSYLSARFTTHEASTKIALGRNAGWLLLMLLLARVDGKSPVEYLSDRQRNYVRTFTSQRLSSARMNLDHLADEWFSELSKLSNRE